MAQYYQIRVGNDFIEVPDWVTLDVFQHLIDIESGSNSTLKNIEQVLRLLLSKDSDIKEINNEIKKSNREAIEGLNKSQNETKDLKDVVDSNLKNLTGVSEQTNKNITQQAKEDKKNTNNLAYRQQLMFERLGTDLSRNFQSIYEGNMRSFGDSIQSLIGNIPFAGGILGGITGMLFGVFEEYVNTITSMSDVGASFGMDLIMLKETATDAGMSLESFSSLISENASTLRILGSNATQGAQQFSYLSNRVLEGAERFNFFGMTNQEINELLIEELELRRKSGQSLEYLTENQDKVAQNFNELMVETSALASITGQSRREMLRERAEALSDVGISAFTERLTESQREAFQAPATMLSGLLGGDLTQNILRSATTGFGLDFYMRGLGVGGEFGQGLRELSQFVSQNYETMDPDLLQERMFEMVQGLEDTIDDELIDTLVRQKDAGNEFAATLLETIQRVRGVEGTFEEYQSAMRRERELLESQEELGIPTQVEQTALALQESVVRQVSVLMPEGEGIIDALRGLEQDFDEETFMQGVSNVFESIEDKDIFLLSNIAGILSDISSSIDKLISSIEGISTLIAGLVAARTLPNLIAGNTLRQFGSAALKIAKTGSGPLAAVAAGVTPTATGVDPQETMTDEEWQEWRNNPDNFVPDSYFLPSINIDALDRSVTDQFENNTNQNMTVAGDINPLTGKRNVPYDELHTLSERTKETNRILDELIRETRRTREAIENQ